MSFATTAAIVGTVGAVGGLASTAYGLAGGNQPQYPNEAASSAEMAQTNAALLPLQRGMQAAATTGGQYTFSLPQGASPASLGIQTTGQGWYDANGNLISTDPNYTSSPEYRVQNLFGSFLSGTGVPPVQPQLTWNPGSATINGMPITQNSDGSYTIDFNGYGTAQAEAQQAQQSAASQLALEQQYAPQFIAQALQEEQQADPESAAARQEMGNLVQQQQNAPLNEPVSTLLNQQIQDTLNAANNNTLTSTDTSRLNAAINDALSSRGESGATSATGALDASQPLTTGFPGEQRQAQAAQSALGFLQSGSDPEDITYRRVQQNLANLAAEASGQTPSSQFSSLTGAQNGPAPMSTAPALPLMQDQGPQAQQIGLQNWQTQMENANQQVNPWMTGLTGLLKVGSALSPNPTLLTPSNPAS